VIIQERERLRGADGPSRQRAIWGSEWDSVLEKDRDGMLVKRMGESFDGSSNQK